MAFDARDIKLLQDGAYLTSPDYPGLRIRARGDLRTWSYRYRSPVDEALRQVSLGRWPRVSVHAAVVEWERLRALRDEGRDPAHEAKAERAARVEAIAAQRVQAEASAYTVKVVAEEYWSGHISKACSPKWATETRRQIDNLLGESGAISAASLTRAQAFDLVSGLSDRPVVAGQLRSLLGAAWDYAIDAGRLPDSAPNWWRLILRGKLKSKGKKIAGEHVGTAKRRLSDTEVGRLIRWLPNFTALLEDALTLYLWTGVRGGEILTAEGRDIARESDGLWWWTIPKEKTKSARHDNAGDLRVPLFGRAQAVMLRRKDLHGEGWLFPAVRRDGKVVATQQKTIQSTVFFHQPYSVTRPDYPRPRLPVTHWAPHDLRRTARTMLSALGCPQDTAEAIIGHMLPGVVGTYNQYEYDAERVLWLKRLSDRLEALASSDAA